MEKNATHDPRTYRCKGEQPTHRKARLLIQGYKATTCTFHYAHMFLISYTGTFFQTGVQYFAYNLLIVYMRLIKREIKMV